MNDSERKERLESGEQIVRERWLRVVKGVENLDQAFETNFPSVETDPIGEQVDAMQPSGPTDAAVQDIDALYKRIELLTRDREEA